MLQPLPCVQCSCYSGPGKVKTIFISHLNLNYFSLKTKTIKTKSQRCKKINFRWGSENHFSCDKQDYRSNRLLTPLPEKFRETEKESFFEKFRDWLWDFDAVCERVWWFNVAVELFHLPYLAFTQWLPIDDIVIIIFIVLYFLNFYSWRC